MSRQQTKASPAEKPHEECAVSVGAATNKNDNKGYNQDGHIRFAFVPSHGNKEPLSGTVV